MTAKYPKVSIIIPVYNGANFMREAIDSALSQTYENVEVIVINDGSTDEGHTDATARSYGDRIRYFCQENGGVASALNFGIRQMDGDYFTWLSHDDIYYPDKVESQIEYLKTVGPTCIGYSNFELIDEDSKVIAADTCPNVAPEEFLYNLVTRGHVNGCTVMIPKECFAETGVFDEDLETTQDYALWFLLAQKYCFFQLSKVLVKSRVHPGQGSTVIPHHWKAVNDLHRWFLDEIDAKNLLGATERGKVQVYLEIAETFNARFFYLAAKHACKLALVHARREGLCAMLKALPSILHLTARSFIAQVTHLLTIQKKRLVG